MSGVTDLSQYRAQKQLNETKNSKPHQEKIYQQIIDGVMGEWEVHYSRGTLNDYVSSKLNVPNANYQDLNEIAALERLLKLKVAIFYPTTLGHNLHGFVARVHIGDHAFATPEMINEVAARLLNIILAVEVAEAVKQRVM